MNNTKAEFMVAVVPLHAVARAERAIDTLLPLKLQMIHYVQFNEIDLVNQTVSHRIGGLLQQHRCKVQRQIKSLSSV